MKITPATIQSVSDPTMNLQDLGYTHQLEKLRIENSLEAFEMGRVISEHKERYIVKTEKGEFEAEITGNLRFSSKSREDFPAVGDWVALTIYDSDFSIIHSILPRYSVISRHAVGSFGEIQIIAANIDYALLVQSADRDFNINRLERYLTICNAAKVSPIIVLSKIDLLPKDGISELVARIQARLKNLPILALSDQWQEGFDQLSAMIEKGKTYCLLGSSGVGKSTLLNRLCGQSLMRTDAISQSTQKGRHVTSHRELIVLENGGILIDNPGMREVGIADAGGGLAITFDLIFEYAHQCKFKDCTHINEIGCAVRDAVDSGAIDRTMYENFLKIEREKAHFDSSVVERRKKERNFGKMLKNYKKDMRA